MENAQKQLTDEEIRERDESSDRYGIDFAELEDRTSGENTYDGAPDAEASSAHANPFPSGDNGVNYHYMEELDEDHLPDLDFYRWDNLFSARVGNSWLREAAKTRPQRKLFGDFWNEGELSILFADTGKGKSILAVQIGEAIASGIPNIPFELEADPQRVLYFDFELSDQQFASRYGSRDADGNLLTDELPFCDNFIRAAPREIDDIPDEFRYYGDFLTASLINLIDFTGARVVIVDNITWLNGSTFNTTAALTLVKRLKRLKSDLGLSILVLAHTPKRYGSSPLTINDLQGSKMLANFADNIFALGDSVHDKQIRYLKHLKLRNAPLIHDASKVCTIRLGRGEEQKVRRGEDEKVRNGDDETGRHADVVSRVSNGLTFSPSPPLSHFLGFTFEGYDRERDHIGWLGSQYDAERAEMIEKVEKLAAEGRSQRQIAHELGISAPTVCRYLNPNRQR